MNTFGKRLKRKALRKNVQINAVLTTLIQPFKEMPSVYSSGKEISDRINAHDLFSMFTADIIKEEVIFAR